MSRRRSASEIPLRRRDLAEAEFVLVVGDGEVLFPLGFTVGGQCHEVVVLGLLLLALGPVGVAEMSGAVQDIP